MESERWREIERVYELARRQPPPHREEFLKQACGDDDALRREVASLLAYSEGAEDYLESSAMEAAARSLAGEQQSPMTGRKISHYRIGEKIGGGGMGIVYKAEDLRLGRFVALKFLPDALSRDVHALERFAREARAASALNHPNICTVYDVGEEQGRAFIAMELLEGEPLTRRISDRRMSMDELSSVSKGIAAALEAAHAAGIIHRDIKPGNIFLTNTGLVKLLDFGVAKMGESTAGEVDPLTVQGLTIGTPAYMSPEQLRGMPLDARTDQFSFGVLLYQMATGALPFPGGTPAVICEAILNRPPAEPKPPLPARLASTIGKALQKDPRRRYQSASEMRAALEGVPIPVRRHSIRIAALAILAIVTIAAVVLIARLHHVNPKLGERDTILLADFKNTTGDPVFDEALKEALAVSLSQSPYLRVLSAERVASTLRLMTLPENTPLSPQVTRELCQRANSRAYVAGSIAGLGGQFVISVQALDCATGDNLGQEQATASGKEAVLDALGKAAARLRAELGESLSSVRKFDRPLAQETTASLEALKAESLAEKTESLNGPAAALPYYRRAVELDSKFAIANEGLGGTYANLGDAGRAADYLTKAFQLRDRTSELEKLLIESQYYDVVTGELDRAGDVYREWEANYPRDFTAPGNFGTLLAEQGKYQAALDETKRALQLDPDQVFLYNNLADYSMALDRFDDAKAAFDQALQRKLDVDALHLARYGLGFLLGDLNAMSEQAAWFHDRPDVSHEMLALQAETEAYRGHVQRARELTLKAVEAALRADNKSAASVWVLQGAIRDSICGDIHARDRAVGALKLAPDNPDTQALAAVLLASESLARELQQRFPRHTLMQTYWLPVIRARTALSKGRPREAIERLQAASGVELGNPLLTQGPSCLYPVYFRGTAYLSAGDGLAAAGEFQKLIGHRGITWNCMTGALAQLQLGRAYAMSGENDKARSTYAGILAIWKDADPGFPLLRRAQAEYAALHSARRHIPEL